jgi:hypothetical protein
VENPSIRINAGGAEAEFKPAVVTDRKRAESIVKKFRGKYGAGDVEKYYSTFDAALVVEMR